MVRIFVLLLGVTTFINLFSVIESPRSALVGAGELVSARFQRQDRSIDAEFLMDAGARLYQNHAAQIRKQSSAFNDEIRAANEAGRDMSQPPSQVSFAISIITSANTPERFNSLKRLCDSLLAAHYDSDDTNVHLRFAIDSSAGAEVTDFVTNFEWPQGSKSMFVRVNHGGLVTAVSESWYPSSPGEHGIILEDDIEVSPYYFLYLKRTLAAHYADPDPKVVGVSMYTPRTVESVAETPRFPFNTASMRTSPDTFLFKYSLPCSWGALWLPGAWAEFLVYMRTRLTLEGELGAEETVVSVPPSQSVVWFGSWKKYMIEMMYTNELYMVYPNFPEQASFSTNHMEVGEHIHSKSDRDSRIQEFTVPLIDDAYVSKLEDQGLISGSILSSLPDTLNDLLLMDTASRPLISSSCLPNPTCRAQTPPTAWHRTTIVTSLMSQSSRDFTCARKIGKHSMSFNDNYLMKRDDQISLLLSTDSGRLAMTRLQIEYYSQSPRVAAIVVTWNDALHPPPPSVRIGDVFVTFRSYAEDALSNRFRPSSKLITDSVIALDYNVRVHLDDVELLYQVLRTHPENVLGFELPLRTDEGGYTIMTGSVTAFSSNYLKIFTCDIGMEAVHTLIDTMSDCDDIALSMYVSAVAKRAAPLYVKPLHHIARFNNAKSIEDERGGGGVSRDDDDGRYGGVAERRETCYDKMSSYFVEGSSMMQDKVLLAVPRIEGDREVTGVDVHEKSVHVTAVERQGSEEEEAFVVCEREGSGLDLWKVKEGEVTSDRVRKPYSLEDEDYLNDICGVDAWDGGEGGSVYGSSFTFVT